MSKFDGHEIDFHEGKFSGGTFDIPTDYAEGMVYEDLVAFVVVGRMDESAVKKGRGGMTKRVNTFKIDFAMPMTVDEGEAVREAMGWETLYGEQLSLISKSDEKPVLTMKAAPTPKPVEQASEPEEEEIPESQAPKVVMPERVPQGITYQDDSLSNFLYGGTK